MLFPDFARKLKGVIGGNSSTSAFTRTLFEAILDEKKTADGEGVLDEYSDSSFKAYFNGTSGISRIAQKVSPYIDKTLFVSYIDEFPDATKDVLCEAFADVFPGAGQFNICDNLADLFVSIIATAATIKKSTPRGTSQHENGSIGEFMDVAPELTEDNAGQMFFIYPEVIKELSDDYEDTGSFDEYLKSASAFYSTKKTLLYAEKPHPFYELYVCNDIRYRKYRNLDSTERKPDITIENASILKLENESKYIIIEGIGGIGKSMLLTHLFLSSASAVEETGRIPILLSLKDYKETTVNMVDFICKGVQAFDSTVSYAEVVDALQNKQLALLLDGLDEIQSSFRDSFDTDLDAFIKSYPGNVIIITSRPVYSFVSYSKFSVFDIEPLSKGQAVELIEKLDFWDTTAKENFIRALKVNLYRSHYQFASNPLLLTIMLMTYSSFGEVPAKMHVFYSKAYETMARLHDATKGSFKRPLHTQLSPEAFAKYFSEFCARTYKDEVLEFTEIDFSSYMGKVLKGTQAAENGVTPHDFLLDLTDNLCIMYCEGSKYYFIHRSFQEYFAAVYFATDYDSRLNKVGRFFERMQHRSYSDRTFDMLYDMIPEKVERYIFLPFLQGLVELCETAKNGDVYWEFLENQYPALYYEEGNCGDGYENEPQSFLYTFIRKTKQLHAHDATDFDELPWPKNIHDLPSREWCTVHSNFVEEAAFDKYPDPELIPETELEMWTMLPYDELPLRYNDYFGEPDIEGRTTEIEVYNLRKAPQQYREIRAFMESPGFPLYQEFQNILNYYEELKRKVEREQELDSEDIFDD